MTPEFIARLGKEVRDQSAHMAAGGLALFPLAIFGINPVTLGWITFCMGMVREVGEEGKPVTPGKIWKALGSKRDLTFWTLGGGVVGLALNSLQA